MFFRRLVGGKYLLWSSWPAPTGVDDGSVAATLLFRREWCYFCSQSLTDSGCDSFQRTKDMVWPSQILGHEEPRPLVAV